MRSLESARDSWQELKQYRALRDLKDAVRISGSSSIATSGCRSACWKIFLIFNDLDTAAWPQILSSSRSAYDSLRAHFLRQIDGLDEASLGYDPLDGNNEPSSLLQLRKDEELRGEVLQDVVRCMPENLYFRQPDTQRILLDVLFIFCKLNPDVSYRQGMHEILAPILWVVERDAIDLGQSSKALGEDAIINAMFDAEYIEHDAFALFGQVMQSAKNFYEQTTMSGKENPMVARSRRIFNDMLPSVDARLANHLETIEIIPQIFLMRWIRLLFGREFAFDDMLAVWDVIFAEDPSLEIVDHVSLTMLLRIHWDLVDADYNSALTLLLKYPEPGKELLPQTLVLDALYLREHMDQHCGSHLVSKYTGRPIQHAGRPLTPPALQRNNTTFSRSNAAKSTVQSQSPSPSRAPRQSRNFEAILQSTARNIYAQGEKLAISKTVRNAMDEVHRRAQEIREIQTPSPPVRYQQKSQLAASNSQSLQARILVLEQRSKRLAALLESAVFELWAYQKSATEDAHDHSDTRDSANIEKLSTAIAKVQVVRVYLDDPGLDVPEDSTKENTYQEAAESAMPLTKERTALDQIQARNSPKIESSYFPDPPLGKNEPQHPDIPLDWDTGIEQQSRELKDPSTSDEASKASSGQKTQIPEVIVEPDVSSVKSYISEPSHQSSTSKSSLSRPRIEQSSFSWMLGESADSSQTLRGTSPSRSRTPQGSSFLFGNDTRDNPEAGQRKGDKTKASDQSSGAKSENIVEPFDFGALRHGKGRYG